jgi:hypothetical protein
MVLTASSFHFRTTSARAIVAGQSRATASKSSEISSGTYFEVLFEA